MRCLDRFQESSAPWDDRIAAAIQLLISKKIPRVVETRVDGKASGVENSGVVGG